MTESVTVPSQSTPKRSRRDACAPLFQWTDNEYTPQIHDFDDTNAGITPGMFTDESTCLDYFKHFVSNDLVVKIVEETNNFYDYLTSKVAPSPSSRLQKWTHTDENKIYLFLAITLLLARNKKLSLKDYWSNDPLLECPQFKNLMTRDRYFLPLRVLHFCDNNNQPEGDRLYKIKLIVNHLREKFSDSFRPFNHLCIDESMVLFKGRLIFRQFIPSKRTRFGIKLFIICDCETGYILDFIVYTGKCTEIVSTEEYGVSGAVVQTLMQKYLGQGHTLWVDNWYTSPSLFNFLHSNKVNSCGTVRKTRKGMPSLKKKLKKGEVEAKYTTKIMALRWLDRREVCMLSTLHSNELKNTDKKDKQNIPIQKPTCVIQYNRNMGAVDRSDMMISSVDSLRKSMKWYRKLFFHIMDMCILNSQTLYNVKTGKNIPLADFQLSVIRELIKKTPHWRDFYKKREATYTVPGQIIRRTRNY